MKITFEITPERLRLLLKFFPIDEIFSWVDVPINSAHTREDVFLEYTSQNFFNQLPFLFTNTNLVFGEEALKNCLSVVLKEDRQLQFMYNPILVYYGRTQKKSEVLKNFLFRKKDLLFKHIQEYHLMKIYEDVFGEVIADYKASGLTCNSDYTLIEAQEIRCEAEIFSILKAAAKFNKETNTFCFPNRIAFNTAKCAVNEINYNAIYG
jgi:hypothetical protein